MELAAWDQPGTFPDLSGPALGEALEELCERRQGLYLATPYLTFGSRFLGQEGQVLKIRASMSRNVAQHTLFQKPLTLRFPWGLTLYGGATRILEYVQDGTGKHLLVAQPARFVRDEQRKAYRTDQTGRSQGTLGVADGEAMTFVRFNVANLSTGGLGIFCTDPVPAFPHARKVSVELALDQGPELKATVQIVHAGGQTLGLRFDPPLAGPAREKLALWLQPRLQEAFHRWEGRAASRAQAERSAAPRPAPSGILLVTSDAELVQEVTEALEGAQDVRTVPPVMAPCRDAVDLEPPVLVLLPCSGSLDECHRLKALMEKIHPPCPVVVVNVGNKTAVKAFAQEVKATTSTERPRQHPVFFRRLVVGLIRKHWSQP